MTPETIIGQVFAQLRDLGYAWPENWGEPRILAKVAQAWSEDLDQIADGRAQEVIRAVVRHHRAGWMPKVAEVRRYLQENSGRPGQPAQARKGCDACGQTGFRYVVMILDVAVIRSRGGFVYDYNGEAVVDQRYAAPCDCDKGRAASEGSKTPSYRAFIRRPECGVLDALIDPSERKVREVVARHRLKLVEQHPAEQLGVWE